MPNGGYGKSDKNNNITIKTATPRAYCVVQNRSLFTAISQLSPAPRSCGEISSPPDTGSLGSGTGAARSPSSTEPRFPCPSPGGTTRYERAVTVQLLNSYKVPPPSHRVTNGSINTVHQLYNCTSICVKHKYRTSRSRTWKWVPGELMELITVLILFVVLPCPVRYTAVSCSLYCRVLFVILPYPVRYTAVSCSLYCRILFVILPCPVRYIACP